ncbi:MAG: MBOAT family protein [Candidatus Thermoplasmatota archaeon]|nr:MBOAT family protein [Candidatus Thermoplasmatota archaeon]MBU1941760.1 MBOAT family protein [Candidatus Thermoplasmatota archaeon]
MLFNSVHFLLFFPVVVFLFFMLPQKYRWMLLLGASYYFYMSWKPEYALLLLIATLTNYCCSILLFNSHKSALRKMYLFIGIVGSIGLLFFFKYFNFLNNSLGHFFQSLSIEFTSLELQVLLPIGISFFTFQTLGYTIDVYRGKRTPERHFGIFALYVSFFPQLVAGPIERAKNLLPQFRQYFEFSYSRAGDGLKLMLWGFFKKIVIADSIAIVVDQIYNNVEVYSGTPLIFATVLFAFQIFCDFSGYSDIAIGAAKIMGFTLMDNFRRPYFARSVVDFWRRWHISLSTWFRDYLYIPLGGNRVPVPRWYLNLVIVFLVAGLWHGANWTFVIWGGLHGMYLVGYYVTAKVRKNLTGMFGLDRFPLVLAGIQIGTTFILVDFGWIFFRANSLSDAVYIVTHLFTGFGNGLETTWLGMSWTGIMIAVCAIVAMEIVHLIQEKNMSLQLLSMRPVWVRWSVYLSLILVILLFGVFERPFIYFQF